MRLWEWLDRPRFNCFHLLGMVIGLVIIKEFL